MLRPTGMTRMQRVLKMQRRQGNANNRKKRSKVRHSKADALPETDLRKLIEEAKSEIFDELVVTLSGYEGMREGEIAHMERGWIDFQKEEITVPSEQPCRAIKGKPCSECIKKRDGIWKPKTLEGARVIPIRIQAKDVISRYFNAFRRVGCTRQTVYNHITDVAKRVKLAKKVYPHSLRSTSASLWGLTGISAPSLCKIMGWKNITSALPYVTADTDTALKEAKAKDKKHFYGED